MALKKLLNSTELGKIKETSSKKNPEGYFNLGSCKENFQPSLIGNSLRQSLFDCFETLLPDFITTRTQLLFMK